MGEAIKEKLAEGKVTREDIFVVTKVWPTYYRKVEESCRRSLKLLGLDYIDMLLMHFPVGYIYKSDDQIWPDNDSEIDNIDYVEVYAQLEKLVEKGFVRSIGVSNFNAEQIGRLLNNCEIKPVFNEIECNPGMTPSKVIEFCKEKKIAISAYCPLGRYDPEKKQPKFFYDERVLEIAKKYGKTVFQIALRYEVDIGCIPIPKSATKSRIEENIQIFDFQLTSEEVSYMKSFSNPSNRVCPFEYAKNATHYPFNADF